MREISTKKIEIGEHVMIDGVEYVAEKGCCYDCAIRKSITCPCIHFCHVGGKLTKVEKHPTETQDKDIPMTNQQLSEWLAKGHGQARFSDSRVIFSGFSFDEGEEDEAVNEDFLIRPWGTDEWIEPTLEIYKRDCKCQ